MAKKNPYEGPAEALELYEELVASNPDVDRKGAKNPYTSHNGHMFSFLDGDGRLAIRLSPEDKTEFRESYESGDVISYGATMRGYSSVPGDLLENTEELAGWFGRSHDYIDTLKPKPTKKPKKPSR